MFVFTADRCRLINLDQITTARADEVGTGPNARTITRATLRDGSDVDLGGDLEQLLERAAPVIAASPGYELLHVSARADGEPLVVHREPIIAWRCTADDIEPVTVARNDRKDLECLFAIKRPDGTVLSANDERYPDEGAWLAARQKLVTS